MKRAETLVPVPAGPVRRPRDELAFLPAALEMMETPPSPIGRLGGWITIAIFVAALAWASIGRIDIVASAMGKIVPSGRSKLIQPFETGVVRAINVRDGQKVKAGETLVELDPTMNQADLGHLQSDLVSTELDIARLKALLIADGDPLAHFYPPAGASPVQIAMQKQFLIDQDREHRQKLAGLDGQKQQKLAEVQTVEANIKKLQAVAAVIGQLVGIRKVLLDAQVGSKVVYLESLQQLVDTQSSIPIQESHKKEIEASVAALVSAHEETEAQYRRALFDQVNDAQRKAAGFAQDLAKAEQRTKFQMLKAPVDGVVQQLAIHTIGGVVTPAQNLMVIVPEDSALEIEAMIPNHDIGFVQAGQRAEIKVDTFNFTRYGLLHGSIVSVSQDAIVQDRARDRNAPNGPGSGEGSSEPPGQQFVYAARVALDRTSMTIDDRQVSLSPGMAVSVEIKTGQRRLITYLLSPILKYSKEVFKER